MGPIPIDLERLKPWEFSIDALGEWLAGQLGAGDSVQAEVPDRLWWLGRPGGGGREIGVTLARGITWPDAAGVFGDAAVLRAPGRMLVLTLVDPPQPAPLSDQTVVLSLPRVITLSGPALRFQRFAIQAAVQAPGGRPAGVDELVLVEPASALRLVMTPSGAFWGDEPLKLTGLPLAMLRTLAQVAAKGKVAFVTPDQLIKTVWHRPSGRDQVKDTAYRIRRAFDHAGGDGTGRRVLLNSRKRGFRLALVPDDLRPV